jgi:glycosyltransferase involved in cell wall biosynthesis
MKIGQFVSFGVGGADKAAETLVKGISELGYEVVVFYNEYSFPKSSVQYDNNTPKTCRFENYTNVEMVKIEMNNISSLNDYGLDILNTHRPGDDFWHLVNFENTDFNFKIIETNFHGSVQTKADIRVYPSHAMIKNHNAPFVVIPNPVEPLVTNENFRTEFNLDGKFVYGRLSPSRKEVYSITNLLAYKNIENENNAMVYVAPCQQARIDAENLGIKNITFIDEIIDSKTISKLYNTFDVFCHSNALGETFGMTVAEAMTYGKPVISHIGQQHWPQAQKELLGELSDTLFITTDILSNYQNLMYKLEKDSDFYNDCSIKLKKIADDNFNYLNVSKKYINLYKKILNYE